MIDFMVENVLQAAIWSILKQIAANRKLKNKSKKVLTGFTSLLELPQRNAQSGSNPKRLIS